MCVHFPGFENQKKLYPLWEAQDWKEKWLLHSLQEARRSRSCLGSASPTTTNLETFFLPSRRPYPKESTSLGPLKSTTFLLCPQITCPGAGLQAPHSSLSWFLESVPSFLLPTTATFFTIVSCTPCPITWLCLSTLSTMVPNRPPAPSNPLGPTQLFLHCLCCGIPNVWPCGFLHSGHQSRPLFLPRAPVHGPFINFHCWAEESAT